MTTLAANLSASAESMRVNAAVADPAPYYQIDSEIVQVLANGSTLQEPEYGPRRSRDATLWPIERAVSGTTATTHTSGATLTPVYDPSAGGGAGTLLSMDNTIDTPVDVTSLIAAGATFIGSEATLRGKDFYAQDADPGAVGTESVWKQTAAGGEWWRRNAADDGWDASFSPLTRATGADQADAVMNAESVDGLADASSTALAIGDGIAQAKNRAEADGAGSADAGLVGESVDGLATTNATATATGTGDAEAGSFATSNTGTARASALAFRGAATAGMAAEIDGTSARLGFNGVTPIARPEIPASPTEQDIADVLVALGLITQAP